MNILIYDPSEFNSITTLSGVFCFCRWEGGEFNFRDVSRRIGNRLLKGAGAASPGGNLISRLPRDVLFRQFRSRKRGKKGNIRMRPMEAF